MSDRAGWVDRLYARLAPARAARSARAEAALAAAGALSTDLAAASAMADTGAGEGGYASGRDATGWSRNWNHGLRDAAGDTLPHLRTLRGQTRDLSRTNGIAAAAIETNVLRAVGTGLALSAQPVRSVLGWSQDQADEWIANVHNEWRLFADSPLCDWRQQLCFDDYCELAARATLDSGDAFTLLPDADAARSSPLMPYRLRLQLIEADRIGNPKGAFDDDKQVGGIDISPGWPARAFVYKRHPGAGYAAGRDWYDGDWVEFSGPSGRRRLLHHFRMLRPEQPRGVPYLAPVVGLFAQLGTYSDAEIKAAIISAYHTLIIETDDGGGPAPVYGLGEAGAPGGGAGQDEIALGPAAIIGLRKGEKANAFNPTRPNPQFGDFVQAVLDQLGAGTFIGSEMLMKKYNTSYVAARAAFLDAWKHLLRVRTMVIRTLCQPVYETWMAEAVILRRIPAPGFFTDPLRRWAYTRSLWQGDSQGSINPKDEVGAYVAAVDARLMSRERAEWELFGTSWNDTYDAKRREHDRLAADGMLPVPKAGAAAPVQPAKPGSNGDSGDSGDDPPDGEDIEP